MEKYNNSILDSGNRREFETGAVRDICEGKGRCDLLPLDQISYLFRDVDTYTFSEENDQRYNSILMAINNYVRTGVPECLLDAIETFSRHHFGGICSAILEVSKHYEDGCKKYGDRNWEKGIPVHCYIDSGVRHYIKFIHGDTDERHDRAFIWNMLGAMWTHEHKPELIDLPFNERLHPKEASEAVKRPDLPWLIGDLI